MTKVHIIYTGVISFYPSKHDGEIKTLWVIAPNGDHPGHRHQLWVGCREDQVSDSTLDVLAREPIPEENNKWAVAFAINGPMTIEGMSNQELQINETKLSGQLVSLSDLVCHHINGAQPKAKLLSNHLSQLYKQRACFRAEIDGGSVESTYVDRQNRWRFSNASNKPKELAEEVCHTFEIEDKRLRLEFSNGAVDLTVKDEADEMFIKIGNTLEMDVLRGRSKASCVDFHVRLFDKLTVSPGGTLPFLVCEKVEGKSTKTHNHGWAGAWGFRGVGAANCPPGWWDQAG